MRLVSRQSRGPPLGMADARAVDELKKRVQHRFQLTVHPYGALARGRPDVHAVDRQTVPGASGLGVPPPSGFLLRGSRSFSRARSK